jgi:hypothetical protein
MTAELSIPKTAPELKSVGLLFRAPLVRANLSGRKSITRRNVSRTNSLVASNAYEKPRQWLPIEWAMLDWANATHTEPSTPYWRVPLAGISLHDPVYVYPRWQPGQVMVQKETFQVSSYCPGEYGGQGEVGYPLRSLKPEPPAGSYVVTYAADSGEEGPWRSPIHLPRWASRFERPLISVTPTRLQEITDADARREGIATGCVYAGRCNSSRCPEHADPMGFGIPHAGPVADFRALFESIHGEGVWDANSCLWRVEYAAEGGAL